MGIICAAAVGAVAVLLSIAGAGSPSYWSDEIATLQASRLHWSDIARLAEHKDAVHAAYYSLVHLWMATFGESEVAVRGFSALAVGIAAGCVVLVGQHLESRRAGVIAGLVFSILPRTTAMGVEARSYALSAACAILASLCFLAAVRTGSTFTWFGYVLCMTVSIYVFMYSLLLLCAHGVFLVSKRRERGKTLRMWLLCAASVIVLSLPLVIAAQSQQGQIAWLGAVELVNPWSVLGEPWAERGWLFAIITVVLLGMIAWKVRSCRPGPGSSLRRFAGLCVIVPTLLLLLADTVAGPLYTARYLSFLAPLVALYLGSMLARVQSRSALTWVSVLLVAAIPSYLAQRGAEGKPGGTDVRAIARVISERAHPGDAVFLQNDGPVTARARLALYGYPKAFDGLNDIAYVRSDLKFGRFADITRTPEDLNPRLSDVCVVWVVADQGRSDQTRRLARLLADRGFAHHDEAEASKTGITRYFRGGTGCPPHW